MSLPPDRIAGEWIALSFGLAGEKAELLLRMLMNSHRVYEHYTSPLGIGWMVNPGHHYGPNIDGYEYSRWGTYHRADHEGIGVDRSMGGTGFTGQYREPLASLYGSLSDCPEELLLFFHHVDYRHRLRDGRTLIQYMYDTHFEGVSEAEELKESWEMLEGAVPPDVFENVRDRFRRQVENAAEWRDQVNTYFYRKSGIADEKGRKIF